MKIKLLLSSAAFAFALHAFAVASAAFAAPVSTTTAVHAKPDAASPAIGSLKAGAEPVAAANAPAAPAGWMAVELAGPFEGYVENKDLTKALDVKPGASIRLAPKADAGVLAIAEKGDKAPITGVSGKWKKVSLEKKLVGYIAVAAPAGGSRTPAVSGSTPKVTPAPASAPAPMSPAPVAPSVQGATASGQAVNLGDGGSSELPRQFAGRFVSTRRPFAPRRPYEYALNDDAGKRYAYLDISKLLLTEQIEKYIDHSVVVFGAAKNAPGAKDIVIQVETLQLK